MEIGLSFRCDNPVVRFYFETAWLPQAVAHWIASFVADGTLSDDDLLTLKCGYVTLLPSNTLGHGVICVDESRLEQVCLQSRLRCLFYMLHVASEVSSHDEGVAILLVMNKLSFERTSEHGATLTQLLNTFPVKLSGLHIVRQPARLGASLFENKVVPTLKALFGPVDVPVHAHSGTPTFDLRKKLAQYGFVADSLPRSLGGGWAYQDFLEWKEQRLILEGAAPSTCNPKPSYEPKRDSIHNGVSVAPTPQAQPLLKMLDTLHIAPGAGQILPNPFRAGSSHQMGGDQHLRWYLEMGRLSDVVNANLVDSRESAFASRANQDGAAANSAGITLNRLVDSFTDSAPADSAPRGDSDVMRILRAALATDGATNLNVLR